MIARVRDLSYTNKAKTVGALVAGALVAGALVVGVSISIIVGGPPPSHGTTWPTTPTAIGGIICGASVLHSPYSYAGAATTFTSGQFGLPTFGSAGTNFPNATSGVIIPTGTYTANNYNKANTVYYFEPGFHNGLGQGINAAANEVFVGGYNSASGEAVVDGDGNSGTGQYPFLELQPSGTDGTVEYLTVQNWPSSQGGAVLGQASGGGTPASGWTYDYDTVGPNEYAPGHSGQDSGGGYGIMGGSDTVIEHDCLTQDDEGGFNLAGGSNPYPTAPTILTGDVVSYNEFSHNGLGEYPDGGSNPYSCGCSAGAGKALWTQNIVITNNYIHDNYNNGVWTDFNNAGSNISHNYISNNWGSGLYVEASYNTNISDNTITGNGWASNGAWPSTPYCTESDSTILTSARTSGTNYTSLSVTATTYSLTVGQSIGIDTGLSPPSAYATAHYQYVMVSSAAPSGSTKISVNSFTANANYAIGTSVQRSLDVNNCTNGFGPSGGFYGGVGSAGITLSDSSGNDNISGSNYSDQFLVENNFIHNNYAAMNIFWDDKRWSGGTNQCNGPLQGDNTTYFQQWKQAQTGNDVTLNGTKALTTSRGFIQFFNPSNCGAGSSLKPSAGWHVYDSAGKIPANDTISSCASATACTLASAASGSETGDYVVASARGGCGLADLIGSAEGTQSGSPAAYYWDNCAWNNRNIVVSHNTFSMASNAVRNCTAANNCGVIAGMTTYQEGYPSPQFDPWDRNSYYANNAPVATSPLDNVFSNNIYAWSGTGGNSAWQFMVISPFSGYVTHSAWTSTYHQDAGSTGL